MCSTHCRPILCVRNGSVCLHKVLQVYACVCMCMYVGCVYMSPVFVCAHNGWTERTLAACVYIYVVYVRLCVLVCVYVS